MSLLKNHHILIVHFDLVSDQHCQHGQCQNPSTDRQRQAGRRRLQTEVSYSVTNCLKCDKTKKTNASAFLVNHFKSSRIRTLIFAQRRYITHHMIQPFTWVLWHPVLVVCCRVNRERGNGQNRFLFWSTVCLMVHRVVCCWGNKHTLFRRHVSP